MIHILNLNNQKVSTIKVGDEVVVPTLFGRFKMIIKKIADDEERCSAVCEDKEFHIGAWLIKEDGYWRELASYNYPKETKFSVTTEK